jgi:hypothetical protein
VVACGFDTGVADVKNFASVGVTLIGLTEDALWATVILGSAFSGFGFFVLAVSLRYLVASVNGCGKRLGVAGVLALATTLRTTSIHSSPNHITSAQLLACFKGGGVVYCEPASLLVRSLRKNSLRFFPFDTAPIFRCVVAAAAQGLPSMGQAMTKEVRARTLYEPRSATAVTMRVTEAWAALAFERALLRQGRLHRHSQNA